MKALSEFINEKLGVEFTLRSGKKSVTISEKDFEKLSKGKTVTEPYPNKRIKIIDGNENVSYNVVLKGDRITVREMTEEEKKWFQPSIYKYIEGKPVFMLSVSDKDGKSLWIPTHALMNPLPKSGEDPYKNKWGMCPVGSNTGTASHCFTNKDLDKVFKMYEKMGYEVIVDTSDIR